MSTLSSEKTLGRRGHRTTAGYVSLINAPLVETAGKGDIVAQATKFHSTILASSSRATANASSVRLGSPRVPGGT